MRLFGRGSTALSTSAVFSGIGAGRETAAASPAAPPAPASAAANAEDETDEMREKREKDEKAAKEKKAAESAKNDDDDDDEDDDCDDEDEEGDDDSDEKDVRKGEKKQAVRSARLRERARCAAIFAHKGADQKLDMAAHLAFNSNMGRDAACAMLDRTPAQASASGLKNSMEPHSGRTPGPNAGTEVSTQAAIDARWDAAMERAKPSSSRQRRK